LPPHNTFREHLKKTLSNSAIGVAPKQHSPAYRPIISKPLCQTQKYRLTFSVAPVYWFLLNESGNFPNFVASIQHFIGVL